MTGLIVDREKCIRLARYLNSTRYISWDECPEAEAFFYVLKEDLGLSDLQGYFEGEDGNNAQEFFDLLMRNLTVYSWYRLPQSIKHIPLSRITDRIKREDKPEPKKFKEMLF